MFKPGDKIKVINEDQTFPSDFIRGRFGQIFTVRDILNGECISLEEDPGHFGYYAQRFELVTNASSAPASSPSLTLPIDSQERKNYPVFRGVVRYFPAALAGVALTSKLGNDKHNPGEELHHARGKSSDHADCIVRHLMDTADLIAASSRRGPAASPEDIKAILTEVNQMAWRALAYSQELHEQFGAPLAPGAKK